ncbi:hypothetical protein NRIC_35830 [Enterococcus florum]|uniref:NlpC/P60 domain-containing protein n=1 Tax=Enterococcus florum TaxID=2480627 RepID=A0A4P5PJC3_9ENTE|nr:C40 family peptidase [Enterococcus florum]GCF95692.1 hypothetical protein NRIC_35830 [Enterococcus florum]
MQRIEHRIKKIAAYGMVSLFASQLVGGWLVLSADPVFADPQEETQGTIDDLQARLMQLNDAIANAQVKKDELETKLAELDKEKAVQESELAELTEKQEKLKKEIAARVRAIQLQENSVRFSLLHLVEWAKSWQTDQAVGAIKKSDEDHLQVYVDLVAKIKEKKAACEQKQTELQTTRQELDDVLKTQAESKAALEQELTDNQALLTLQQEEQRQQELAHQQAQEELLEEIVQEVRTVTVLTSEEEVSDKAQAIIQSAKNYLGVPYVWGGTSPAGFDCSGLVQWVYAENGVSLPRVSQAQQGAAESIPISELRPGDLVFWGNPAHHVGIYIGSGYYIHAPQPGEVVKVTHSSYYPFSSAGRVLRSE